LYFGPGGMYPPETRLTSVTTNRRFNPRKSMSGRQGPDVTGILYSL
jgi:hypothetical protein